MIHVALENFAILCTSFQSIYLCYNKTLVARVGRLFPSQQCAMLLPTLMNRRLQDIAIIMYKVKFKLAPSYILDLFSTNHTAYNLRVKEFTIPRFNSIHYGKHSLRYLGPVLWAKLPSHVRSLYSSAGFKRAVGGLDLEMLMDDSGCACLVCNA